MLALILGCILREEAIEVGVAAPKRGAVVAHAQRTNRRHVPISAFSFAVGLFAVGVARRSPRSHLARAAQRLSQDLRAGSRAANTSAGAPPLPEA